MVNGLAAFGFSSGLVQFATSVWNIRNGLPHPAAIAGGLATASVAWGALRGRRLRRLSWSSSRPPLEIVVSVDDLMSVPEDIVVGFADTFDTDTSSDRVISGRSLQGQLLARKYGGSIATLDRELTESLVGCSPLADTDSTAKSSGKTVRYPLGTVARLTVAQQRVYCVAYSSMRNDLRAESSTGTLWSALMDLWAVVATSGDRRPLAVPLMGGGHSRIRSIDREMLLKVILLSFICAHREHYVTDHLRVVLQADDLREINLLEIKNFLSAL